MKHIQSAPGRPKSKQLNPPDARYCLRRATMFSVNKNGSAAQLKSLAAELRWHVKHSDDLNSEIRAALSVTANALDKQARELQSKLLDDVQRVANIYTDTKLAKALESEPSNLSRIRSGYSCIGPTQIVRIHELTDWPIREIKARLNLPCLSSRVFR